LLERQRVQQRDEARGDLAGNRRVHVRGSCSEVGLAGARAAGVGRLGKMVSGGRRGGTRHPPGWGGIPLGGESLLWHGGRPGERGAYAAVLTADHAAWEVRGVQED
jgi:hypothetical protein